MSNLDPSEKGEADILLTTNENGVKSREMIIHNIYVKLSIHIFKYTFAPESKNSKCYGDKKIFQTIYWRWL